jgi:tetratricopeptide (TPR) repeat protein
MRSIEARLSEALVARGAGDNLRARELCEEVLLSNPRQADALHILGLLAELSGDLPRARAFIEKSLSIVPNSALAHFNLANICDSQGDLAGAVLGYEAAVAIAPDFAEAYSNLGNVYGKSGRREDALRSYAAAIRAKPDFAVVYCNLGALQIDLERYDDAISTLLAALRLAPDIPDAHANLGQAYRRMGRFREAIASSCRALELRPGDRDACLNISAAAVQIDELAIALEASRRALEIDAASAETQYNRGWLCQATGRYAEAIPAYEAAIAARPDYAQAHVNMAFALLGSGDFARGWDEFIWSWRLPEKRAQYPYLDRATLWTGEAFPDRQLLITREQGFGDAIQMARYLPAVKARGGRVVLEAAPALVPLFEGLSGVDELRLVRDVTVHGGDVDLFIPLCGLPRVFGTNLSSIPAPIPYLRAPNERVARWHPRFERSTGLRVGIAWAGNPNHADDHRRSCRLEDFAALGELDGIAWFGLQKGREEQRRSCGSLTLDPLGAEIADFADTAAILTHLDLMIAIDSAVVHLAGALGKPVWTLLPFAPDWRWMRERGDSPWYPTMRLFRQPCAGDWASVFAEVARELRAFRSSAVSRTAHEPQVR